MLCIGNMQTIPCKVLAKAVEIMMYYTAEIKRLSNIFPGLFPEIHRVTIVNYNYFEIII
jgi:hypothetical protein